MTRLRLLTLNIDGNRSPWRTRKLPIRNLLEEESADLVAMQEVLRPQGAGTAQADELAAGLGYRVAYAQVDRLLMPFPCEVGHAVLSRFPLREQRTELLPAAAVEGQLGEGRHGLLYVLLSVKVGLLPLLVARLPPELTATRQSQLQHIGRYIAAEVLALPGRVPPHVVVLPPLLVGDFGRSLEVPELALLAEAAGLYDCPSAGQLSPTIDTKRDAGHVLLGATPAGVVKVRSVRRRLVADESVSAVVVDLELGEPV